jgi:hypothetical protein
MHLFLTLIFNVVASQLIIDKFKRPFINELDGHSYTVDSDASVHDSTMFLTPLTESSAYFTELGSVCFDLRSFDVISVLSLNTTGHVSVSLDYFDEECAVRKGNVKLLSHARLGARLYFPLIGLDLDIRRRAKAIVLSFNPGTLYRIKEISIHTLHLSLIPGLNLDVSENDLLPVNVVRRLEQVMINGTIYEIKRQLGKGHFGSGYLIQNEHSKLVLKIESSTLVGSQQKRRNACWSTDSQEVEVLKHLGYYRGNGLFNNHLVLAMLYFNGLTIDEIIFKRSCPAVRLNIGVYLKALFEANKKLHKSGIAHGDNKLHNTIFVPRFAHDYCSGVTGHLIDFGNAKLVRGDCMPKNAEELVQNDLCMMYGEQLMLIAKLEKYGANVNRDIATQIQLIESKRTIQCGDRPGSYDRILSQAWIR